MDKRRNVLMSVLAVLMFLSLQVVACGKKKPPTPTPTATPTGTSTITPAFVPVATPTASPTGTRSPAPTPTQAAAQPGPTSSSATASATNSPSVLVTFDTGEGISRIVSDTEGNIYAAGARGSASSIVPFIRKYSCRGTEVWTHSFAAVDGSPIQDIVVDGLGNIVVLCPGTMTKFDSDGTVLSTVRFNFPRILNSQTSGLIVDKRVHIKTGETELSPSPETWLDTSWVAGLAVDERGNTYVVGKVWASYDNYKIYGTDNAFLARFDSSGNMLSYMLFGHTRTEPPHSMDEPRLLDRATSVAVDRLGRIYVAGYTYGDLTNTTGAHTFLGKYSEDGSELWHEEFPSAFMMGEDPHVVVDTQEGVYLAGEVEGTQLEQSSNQMLNYVRKYESTGIELWTRQVAAGGMGYSDLALDSAGFSYVTNGELVRKYDADGNEVATQDLQSIGIFNCTDVEADSSSGGIYLLGKLNLAGPGCIARLAIG